MPRDTIDLPVIERAALVRADSIDEAARTVDIIWTTGATVRCFSWADGEIDEELIVDPGAVRMDRLNGGAPFLNSHNADDLSAVLGVVVDGSARIEGGQGVATIRFSQRDEVEPIWRDIIGGIIRNVSVGYRVYTYEVEKRDGQRPLYRAVDWEPLEVSAVAIGADAGAQIRSDSAPETARHPCLMRQAGSAANAVNMMEKNMNDEITPAAAVTDAPPTAVQARAASPAQPETVPDPIAVERQRAAEITALCHRHGLAEIGSDMIARGVSVDAARAAVLDRLSAQTAAAGGRSEPALGRGQDETETRRRGMEDALFAGLTRAAPSELAQPFAGHSLTEMAARRLGEQRVPSNFGAREEMLRRAFLSTSDFPLLFENAMNRALAARYAEATPTYRQIARQRTYQDFRDHRAVRVGDFPTLQLVSAAGGEIPSGSFGEAREKTAVLPYGVMVNISRQMLVNDTLDGISQVLNDRGAAVARFEDATFYAMMLSGTAANGPTLLETTRQVFNATDGTLAGTAAAISITSLSLGRSALRKRKSLDGNDLGLSASILLVGPDKETEAQQIVAPLQAQQAGNVNPFSGLLTVVTTAKLTGNSWYVFAAPADAPCFEWGLLQGYEAPRFRIEEVFGRQGTSMSLEHDFGCGAIDFRGGYRNAGA